MKTGIVKAQNGYRNARLRAARFNRLLTNMDTACESLFISRRHLWEIESGLSSPDAQTVKQMVKVYRAAELAFNYCASCPIGQMIGAKKLREMTAERVALQAIVLMNKAQGIADRLTDAAKDGTIDKNGAAEFIAWSGEVTQLGKQLTVIIEGNIT